VYFPVKHSCLYNNKLYELKYIWYLKKPFVADEHVHHSGPNSVNNNNNNNNNNNFYLRYSGRKKKQVYKTKIIENL